MKKLLICASFATILSCAPGAGENRLPDAQYKEMMNYQTAAKVAAGCGRFQINPDEPSFNTMIDQQLMSEGYTAQQSQDMIAAGISETDFNNNWVEFLDSLNVDPSRGMTYCTLGERARAARPDVGQYFALVSPAQ